MEIWKKIIKWFAERTWPIIKKWIEDNLEEIIKRIMDHIKDIFKEKHNKEAKRYEENIIRAEQKFDSAQSEDEKKAWQETVDMLKKMYADSKIENEILKQELEKYKKQVTNDFKQEIGKVKGDDIFYVNENKVITRRVMIPIALPKKTNDTCK